MKISDINQSINFKDSNMNKAKVVLFAAAFLATSAFAMDGKKSKDMMMNMSAMDANHDGMVSKREFTKYHDNMWKMMQKNKSGMVDMKDMEIMHSSMMKGGTATQDSTMMKDKSK